MKKCDCEFWHTYIGDYFDKTDEGRGTYRLLGESNTPFYFGVEIHYCPWCGRKLLLIEEENLKLINMLKDRYDLPKM